MGDSTSMKKKRSWVSGCYHWVMDNISIEPTLFLYKFAINIVIGSEVNTNMLIWKVCRYEMGYNETVCEDLSTDDQWDDQEADVQRQVNDVQLVQGWIDTGCSLFFVFFTGAISDHFGRLPLILVPLIGYFLAAISQIINYTVLESLPVEFFYLESLGGVMGGYSVYYLGVYGFGVNFAKKANDRAHTISRYDGTETLANTLGTWLSPIVFNAWGYYGNYSVEAACILMGIIYLLIVPKEPHKPIKKDKDGMEDSNIIIRIVYFLYKHIVLGTIETLKTILKPRDHYMRELMIIQFFEYALMVFYSGFYYVLYLYMQRVFGATGEDYSHMKLITNLLQTLALFLIVPFMTKRLKMFEAAVIAVIAFTGTVGYVSMACADTLLGFFFAFWSTFMLPCQYGPGRALISKSVGPDEVGKILSGNAILSAGIPLGGGPAYRSLYDYTLETTPSAFIWLTASLTAMCCCLQLFVFSQRRFYYRKRDEDEKMAKKQKEIENLDASIEKDSEDGRSEATENEETEESDRDSNKTVDSVSVP